MKRTTTECKITIAALITEVISVLVNKRRFSTSVRQTTKEITNALMKQFWLFILLCSTPYYLSMSNAVSSISPGSRLACIHGFWRNCIRHLSRRAFHEQHLKKSIVLIYKPTCLLARINCFIRSTIHKIPYGFILNGSKTYTIACQSFDISWQKGIPIEKYVATCCLF